MKQFTAKLQGTMRQRRLKWTDGPAVYHCISRVVAGAFLLDEAAKERWCAMLHQVADFSGVEILAFCVMSNHFHLLVRVTPLDRKAGLDRAELFRRYRKYYALGVGADYPSPAVLEAMFEKAPADAERWKRRLEARMGDLSEFMKTLKQRFTTWFNATHRRYGTLWSERFKSLMVEDSPAALMTIAAYIDLNPVRAGIVDDPHDYPWSSCRHRFATRTSADTNRECEFLSFTRSEYETLIRWKRPSQPENRTGSSPDESAIEAKPASAENSSESIFSATQFIRKRRRVFSRGILFGSNSFIEERKRHYGDQKRPPPKRIVKPPLLQMGENTFLSALTPGNRRHFET